MLTRYVNHVNDELQVSVFSQTPRKISSIQFAFYFSLLFICVHRVKHDPHNLLQHLPLSHNLRLQSSYYSVSGMEASFTNFTQDFVRQWFSCGMNQIKMVSSSGRTDHPFFIYRFRFSIFHCNDVLSKIRSAHWITSGTM
jgi:hypothetical protein